jgi:hypothetical protein
MEKRFMTALDDMDPDAVFDLFRRAGMRVRERCLPSPNGPRWAIWLHVPEADVWVEAHDRAGAWRKAVAYALDVGLLQ